MSETDLGQSGSGNAFPEGFNTEGGALRLGETAAVAGVNIPTPERGIQPTNNGQERVGTVEHLAARRPISELDAEQPEIKERLKQLQPEVTRLVTGLRWNGKNVDETAEELVPLLNIGPVQQWQKILIPFLFEIDRAGNLITVWNKIIEWGDPKDLPPGANPAETGQGRARRYGILMLGNYKGAKIGETEKTLGFARGGSQKGKTEVVKRLGELAGDPSASLYAAPALVKQGSSEAVQELIKALKDAQGWAKVDIIENCLELKQAEFNDLLLASGLEHIAGLESYVAIPLYRELPLEDYLNGSNQRLKQQAALIIGQVEQDSQTTPGALAESLPPIFARPLAPMARALFGGARSMPHWSNVTAVHRLGILLGNYWAEISHGKLLEPNITEPVYETLPMMNEIERWMAGPGRDVLLRALTEGEEAAQIPVARALGELREPRAIAPLIERIESANAPENREQAQRIGIYSETLGQMGDQRASRPLWQLVERTVDIGRRRIQPRRTENLPTGDRDIPGSIVYGSAIKALGRLGERNARGIVQQASEDFDPYVRTQALEALKQLDPSGEEARSREIARAGLHDGRESIVRLACQLCVQYKDYEAVPTLREIIQARPTLAATAYESLRQLGQ